MGHFFSHEASDSPPKAWGQTPPQVSPLLLARPTHALHARPREALHRRSVAKEALDRAAQRRSHGEARWVQTRDLRAGPPVPDQLEAVSERCFAWFCCRCGTHMEPMGRRKATGFQGGFGVLGGVLLGVRDLLDDQSACSVPLGAGVRATTDSKLWFTSAFA